MKDFTICVGTVGAGVWYSPNGGEKWRRSKMNLPFHAEPGEIQIRALAVYPQDPNRILAGSEVGLYRSEDKGATWDLVESPIEDYAQIWSVAVHPTNPDIIFAGTKPPGLFRSIDGGKHWEKLPIPIAERCFAGAPKVTNILNQDVHGLAIGLGKPTKLHVTTPDGIWTSTTEGESWTLHGFPRFFERDKISYCRGVALKQGNPDVIFVGNGDFIPGKTGAIQRSTDGGKTWEAAKLPTAPNSTIYWFGTHPADPDVIVANSLHGYVYTSTDGGESWNKVNQEFGEIRAIAWAPN
jgi:photosystem II stability/assembly factor-like uncharacterized protein